MVHLWYDGVASNHKPPCRKSPTLKGSVVTAWEESALACALRKKAAPFRDANRAVVLEIVRWAITANHPRMVRYGFVQLRRAILAINFHAGCHGVNFRNSDQNTPGAAGCGSAAAPELRTRCVPKRCGFAALHADSFKAPCIFSAE
jgi:hypothetical protein